MDRSYLAANWADVRRRVDAACREAGRDPAEVSILPVSKTFDADVVRAAVALGLRRFGENKVQEIRDKSGLLADCGIAWVVIGDLQTNKAKEVARLANEVQSLDRLELAEALNRRLQLEGRIHASADVGPVGSEVGMIHEYGSLRSPPLPLGKRIEVRGGRLPRTSIEVPRLC